MTTAILISTIGVLLLLLALSWVVVVLLLLGGRLAYRREREARIEAEERMRKAVLSERVQRRRARNAVRWWRFWHEWALQFKKQYEAEVDKRKEVAEWPDVVG